MREIFYSTTRDDDSSEDEYDHAASYHSFQTPLPSSNYQNEFNVDDFDEMEIEVNLSKPKFVDKIEKTYKNTKEKLQKKIKQKLNEMNEPSFVLWKDKLSFTLGVTLLVMTTIIACRFPLYLPIWYVSWCITLISLRFYMYHSQAYHYFLIDFCYLANALLIFYLFYYPSSAKLFILNFANANGAVSWAIITWRNSLVFHDFDKITTVFIHAFPITVVYVLKWFPEFINTQYSVCLNSECTVGLYDIVVPHMMFYLFWQISYYVKTEIVDRKKFESRPDIVTSFRWMQRDKKSAMGKLLERYPEQYQVFIFMGCQALFHFAVVLPVYLSYHYFWFNTLLFAYKLITCVHNGASFYIHVFAKNYVKNILKLTEQLDQVIEKEKTK